MAKPQTLPNTPGTAGGPGGRDGTLAVKCRKTARKSLNSFNCLEIRAKTILQGLRVAQAAVT